jgi:hypothetical protein
MHDIFISNVVTAPSASIAQAGFFYGLGATPATGQIYGIALSNVDLGSPAKGFQCVNVSGTSSGVTPEPCAELRA